MVCLNLPQIVWVETNYNIPKYLTNSPREVLELEKRMRGGIMPTNDILFEHFDDPSECAYGRCGRILEQELAEKGFELFPCIELAEPGVQHIRERGDKSHSGSIGAAGVSANFTDAEGLRKLILLEGEEDLDWIRECIKRRHLVFSHIGAVIDYDTNEGAYKAIKEELTKDFCIKTVPARFPYSGQFFL